MFGFGNPVITKVFNPLNINKNSIIEFNIGELANTGIYRFKKIIEISVGEKIYTRYLIYSKSENTEYVFEVFPNDNNQLETYLYNLTDTIPFSEDFLDVAGQKFLTTPQGNEYQRVIMPNNDDRIDGIVGKCKIYDIQSDQIQKETEVQMWDYSRDNNRKTEYLNIEMIEDTGMFRIFVGEVIEDIFYKFYQNPK